jgi:RND family efflux transporter MFP subunit
LFSVERDAYEAALLRAEADLATAEATLMQEQAQADVAADEARRNPNRTYTDLFLRKPQVLSAKAQVKSAQAALKIAQRDLRNTDVVAPFDALVVSKSVGLGQYLNQGEATATLFSVEQALIRVPIPGFEAAFLPDSVANIAVEVTSGRSGDVTRIGQIRHDLGIVDEATRMSHLLIQLDDPYGLQSGAPAMKFGSYLQVSFPGRQLNHVYKVPQELVTNRTLWLVDDESKLRPRQVDVVREESGFVIIGAGIADKDRVVTSPPEYPRDGMTVRVKAPSNEQTAGQEVSTTLSSL